MSPKEAQASPKLDPVNLDNNFAAAPEVGPGDDQKSASPSSSDNGVTVHEHSIGREPPPNAIFQKIKYSEA